MAKRGEKHDEQQQQRYVELIQKWRTEASNAAWEELWRMLFPYLVRCASTLIYDQDEQVDVASDAFIHKIMGNLHRYDPRTARFTTWCWKVTQNACRDRLRRRHASQLDDGTAAKLEAAETLNSGDVSTVASYTVFRISDEAVSELIETWAAYKSIPNAHAQTAVKAILDEHSVAWRRHGSIEAITSFLFAVIRLSKLTAADKEAALCALDHASPNTPEGFLIPFIGKEAVSLMVLLFGGTYLHFPTIPELRPKRNVKR